MSRSLSDGKMRWPEGGFLMSFSAGRIGRGAKFPPQTDVAKPVLNKVTAKGAREHACHRVGRENPYRSIRNRAEIRAFAQLLSNTRCLHRFETILAARRQHHSFRARG